MFNLPRQFVWKQTLNESFLDALKQEEFVSRLSMFEKTSFTSDSKGINLATEQFTTIINDACLHFLRLAYTKKSSKKQKKIVRYRLWVPKKTIKFAL